MAHNNNLTRKIIDVRCSRDRCRCRRRSKFRTCVSSIDDDWSECSVRNFFSVSKNWEVLVVYVVVEFSLKMSRALKFNFFKCRYVICSVYSPMRIRTNLYSIWRRNVCIVNVWTASNLIVTSFATFSLSLARSYE